jgi:hypothetical protein
MARKGGYLGGSSIIRARPKRSNTSKRREKRQIDDALKLVAENAAYEERSETSSKLIKPSKKPPSKAVEEKSRMLLKELGPVVNNMRQLACGFSEISGEPSSLVHDLAIFEFQSMENVTGTRRSVTGFDGWRSKERVVAVGAKLPQSSEGLKNTAIQISQLNHEWDELFMVFFNEEYQTQSIYRMNRSTLRRFIDECSWGADWPVLDLPIAVAINLSDHVSGNRLEPIGSVVVEGGGRKIGKKKARSPRYFRSE